jgi:ABC-type bacteriocin/lantibiotic exporter with double-glycine peptidase domain
MFARTALGLLQGCGRAVLQSLLDVRLTHEMGARLLALPLTFIESRSHGDLLARIAVQKDLRELLSRTVQAGFDLLLIALLVVLMIAYDAELGALVLALVGLRVLVVRASRKPLDAAMSGELVARTGEVSSLAEAVSMSEMTKGFGVEAQISDRYERQVRERVRWSIACERVQSSAARALLVVGVTMQATILLVGGTKVLAGEMTLGVYAGFLSIWTLLEGPIASLIDLVEGWARTRGILQRCDDILEIPRAVCGSVERERLEGHLVVRDLGFRFGTGGPWVLRNVSFSIQPKEHVALVGPSGHGKTTLGKLLCGLLAPSEGSIQLDGVELSEYQGSRLARRYGVVLQEPAIIEGKVSEILRLRDPDSSADAMREAARVSAFDDVIARLPDQYDSVLAPMGRNLSGGERQRLAIAQAVLGAPDVLLLDEATCSLDIDLERRVMTNIEGLGATVISIAHRPTVSARADRVLQVQDGGVIELSGPAAATPGLPARRLDEAS